MVLTRSSHSAEKFSEKSSKSSPRAVCLNGLGILDQANGGAELRVLKGRGQSGHRLGVGDVHRHFKNLLREVIDAAQLAATPGDEHSRAGVIEEGFFPQLAL
jgi:hypothetical protein